MKRLPRLAPKLKSTESPEKLFQLSQEDDLSRLEQFQDDPKTFLHSRPFGNSKKLTDGDDVTDSDGTDDVGHL